MNKKTIIYTIVFIGITIGCIGFAWSDMDGSTALEYVIPLFGGATSQTKEGSITIEKDLTIEGDSNICRLSSTGVCPTGYYTSSGSTHGTYIMCCKVSNK